MSIDEIKIWGEIISHLAPAAAILAAGWWFLVTTRFKQRVQFDIDCNFFTLHNNNDSLIAELQFIFENKGFVEHRLYNLNVSVHTLQSETILEEKDATKELDFKKRVLPQVSIVPEFYNYYFVRPGSRQVITHIIQVSSSLSVIRVTASFNYNRNFQFPHTARRVFKVQDSSKTG